MQVPNRAFGHRNERQLPGVAFGNLNVAYGSAVPVCLIELRTYALRRMPTGGARPCATALENEHLRAAVRLWRLYSKTARWRGEFLADGMTANGRLPALVYGGFGAAQSLS